MIALLSVWVVVVIENLILESERFSVDFLNPVFDSRVAAFLELPLEGELEVLISLGRIQISCAFFDSREDAVCRDPFPFFCWMAFFVGPTC